jgi:tetratricopeptide (TPR) repeat protein
MARALTHKKSAKTKAGKIARSEKTGKSSTASRNSRGNPALKAKASSKTDKSKSPMKKGQKPLSSVKHPVKKEKAIMEAESRNTAQKTIITSAPAAPPRLLNQTKTTAAALALLEKGIEHIHKKDCKKARGDLKTLLDTYPGELDILARARSWMQICDREEALQKKTAITADQLYALGVMEHNKANYDKAVSYFHRSIESHPDADYIYYSVAASLSMKGELKEALKNLRKAVELNEESRIYAKNDPDFSSLQTEKEFQELVGLSQSPS